MPEVPLLPVPVLVTSVDSPDVSPALRKRVHHDLLADVARSLADMARDCSQGGVSSYGGGGRAGGNCYNCGGFGHMAAACPSQRGNQQQARSQVCYNCQQPGHRANECSNERVERPPMKCFNCGNEGHAQRDCPEERVGGAYGGDKKCYVSLGSARDRSDRDGELDADQGVLHSRYLELWRGRSHQPRLPYLG